MAACRSAREAPLAAAQGSGRAVDRITLTAGRSTVLPTDFDITRIAVTNPAVADATVVAPREVLIDGKASGTISLIMWGAGRRVQYDLVVDPGVGALQQQLRGLFPGEDISVAVNEEATTLSGRVSSNAVMLKAGEIAEKTSSKSKVINLLQVPGGIESQQVMLQVRFAEVNRNALTELGISLFTGAERRTGLRRSHVDATVLSPCLHHQWRDQRAHLQRFPEPVRVQYEIQRRSRPQGARDERVPSESGRAEPDCV